MPADPNAAFKWWLFVSNLGDNTSAIIGRGIVSAEIAEKTINAVILVLHTQDHTQIGLEIRSRSTGILESIVTGSTATSGPTSSQ